MQLSLVEYVELVEKISALRIVRAASPLPEPAFRRHVKLQMQRDSGCLYCRLIQVDRV